MRAVFKRIFDVLASGLGLMVLSPLLLLLAIWIRLDSKGPVIFLQKRVGLNVEPFLIFKFRSMVDRPADAIDQHDEKVVSEGDDPRITRAGRFLRATSLDELPQLINIFQGDMSVVGPRPVIPEQVEVVPEEYRCRFGVRPGLTGLAQVRGRRSLGWLDQLACDAEYVREHGFWYDIGIILKTALVVLRGSGVYGGEGQNWRAYRDILREQQGRSGKE